MKTFNETNPLIKEKIKLINFIFEVPENSYLEERRLHKLTQYGEGEPEKKANENVLGRYNAIAGNLVNEIRQFNPRLFP